MGHWVQCLAQLLNIIFPDTTVYPEDDSLRIQLAPDQFCIRDDGLHQQAVRIEFTLGVLRPSRSNRIDSDLGRARLMPDGLGQRVAAESLPKVIERCAGIGGNQF